MCIQLALASHCTTTSSRLARVRASDLQMCACVCAHSSESTEANSTRLLEVVDRGNSELFGGSVPLVHNSCTISRSLSLSLEATRSGMRHLMRYRVWAGLPLINHSVRETSHQCYSFNQSFCRIRLSLSSVRTRFKADVYFTDVEHKQCQCTRYSAPEKCTKTFTS